MKGKCYKDYLTFIGENSTIPTTQMGTVCNHQNGPHIQHLYGSVILKKLNV